MSSYFVYALSSIANDWIYVGMSQDVLRRFREHQKGYEKTTKPYAPFVLIYSEECEDRIEARKREKYWKGGSGKRKLRVIRNELSKGSNLPASRRKAGPPAWRSEAGPSLSAGKSNEKKLSSTELFLFYKHLIHE